MRVMREEGVEKERVRAKHWRVCLDWLNHFITDISWPGVKWWRFRRLLSLFTEFSSSFALENKKYHSHLPWHLFTCLYSISVPLHTLQVLNRPLVGKGHEEDSWVQGPVVEGAGWKNWILWLWQGPPAQITFPLALLCSVLLAELSGAHYLRKENTELCS